MRQIYTIGETVLDIIFQDFSAKASKAGGSMLNAAVSMGRLKLPVNFVSEYGQDDIGNFIDNFLNENNINTSLVYRYKTGKTSISIANLDANNNANYSFYKDLPEKRIDIKLTNINKNDIILFGSYFAINKDVHNQIIEFLKFAKEKEAIIIYDPNYRKAHLYELEILKPLIIENMLLADIIRGSDDDFEMIFGAKNPVEAYTFIKHLCPNFICTSSKNQVFAFTENSETKVNIKKINPLSTIGAGDTFNAGLIYEIYKNNLGKEEIYSLNELELNEIIHSAIEMATDVCLSYDNYISVQFAEKKLKS